MSSRARNKLNVKQVSSLTKVGVYSDGGGLYLRVRPSGRSWFYIGMLGGKRIEMGLGSVLDVSLAKAREKAAAARECTLEGRDPRAERAPSSGVPAVGVTFGTFAMQLVDSIEDGFRNPKHRQQWRNTLKTYAASMFEVPIGDVATEHVLAALQPIWLSKPETASRDSKLRGCDLVQVRIGDVVSGGRVRDRAIIVQQKTKRPVQFELMDTARKTMRAWLERRGGTLNDYVSPSRNDYMAHMSTRQYARLVHEWVVGIGLQPQEYGTHSLRRTRASIIYKATGNLRAVQILLGHAKIESTVRYLGVDVEDALELAERTEV